MMRKPTGTRATALIRIRVIQKPPVPSIDGLRLDLFEPGVEYEVGNLLGALLLAERWAEPATFEESTVLAPSDFEPDGARFKPT